MPAKTLMVQGTASHVGKSVIAAALCRIFTKKGFRVAPFKAQNMANNSFATKNGGEIGRAQAVQAAACGMDPTVYMNPVLLKPSTDQKAQVVLLGEVQGVMGAWEYQSYKKKLFPIVIDSLKSLMDEYDLIILEGAGSPAEINLKEGDIVNMSVAKAVSSPVLLVGDIDKGGLFAQFVGTCELLDREENELVKGFLVNKFRGDKKILDPGLQWLEERKLKKVLGVIPYIKGALLEEEDSMSLNEFKSVRECGSNDLLIHVVKFPRISNFTDFEPLQKEAGVRVVYLERPDRHALPDLLILPGTKSTLSDLDFLRESGFAEMIAKYIRMGVPLLGICGGYQMLGEKLLDPHHAESSLEERDGLGLVPSITVFEKNKRVSQVKAIHLESSLEVEGYEIHMGCTQGRDGSKPLFKITQRHGMSVEDFDGICVESKEKGGAAIWGTYIHGLFDNAQFRSYFLNRLRTRSGLWGQTPLGSVPGNEELALDSIEKVSTIVEDNIDMSCLEKIIGV